MEWRESDRWALLGKIVRIGIVVAAVIVGYCIFSVQVRGNYQSEYFAERITVTHMNESGGKRSVYCIDFVEEQVVYYCVDVYGNQQRQWSKPLKEAELERFMEDCNEKELLGRSYVAAEKTMPGYCQIHTYSTRGERLVYDSSGRYLDGDALEKELDQVFYDLTGIHCLTDP